MAVKSIVPMLNTAPNNERGPSEALWAGQGFQGGYWIEDFLQDPRLGYHFFDDMERGAPSSALGGSATTGSYGNWGLYGYANATIVDNSAYGGVLQLVAGTTSHQGIALTSFAGMVQLVDSTSTIVPGCLVFEASVGVNSISTSAASAFDAFVGLTDKGAPAAGQPITTTGNSLYNSCNLISFQRIASVGNDWSFVYQASGVAAVYPTNLQTLISTVTGSAAVASTLYKLGFIYHPKGTPILVTSTTTGNSALAVAAVPLIQVFVNGQAAPAFLTNTALTSSNFPQGYMGPAIAIMNSSTGTGLTTYVDWVRLAQQGWK